jgi:hypothetical protein
MLSLYRDPHFTLRFAEDRIIQQFHLDGVEAGQRVAVFQIDPGAGERLGLLATATAGDGGWVDLDKPIIVRDGDVFVIVPELIGPFNGMLLAALLGHGRGRSARRVPTARGRPAWLHRRTWSAANR